MGFTRTDGGWIKGVEERVEDRAEEEGPSSPLHDIRAASPDIQFFSDPKAGPSESTRRHTPVQQPDSRALPSEIRLADDQIEMISQRVASLLSRQWGTSAFAQGSTSHDVSD